MTHPKLSRFFAEHISARHRFDADDFTRAVKRLRLGSRFEKPSSLARAKRLVRSGLADSLSEPRRIFLADPVQARELADLRPAITAHASTPEEAVRLAAKLKPAEIIVCGLAGEEERLYSKTLNALGDAQDERTRVHRYFADIVENAAVEAGPFFGPAAHTDLSEYLGYSIICTGRSGSTYLCDLLSQTGVLGRPKEHLKEPLVYLLSRGLVDPADLARRFVLFHSTPNKVFGTKIISRYILELLGDAPLGALKEALPKTRTVYLSRADKVAQAASIIRAQKTGRWHSVFAANAGGPAELADEQLDDAVRVYLENLERQEKLDEMVEALFAPEDIHRISYEDVVADPAGVVIDIAAHVGVATPADPDTRSRHRKLPEPDDIYERLEAALRARGITPIKGA